MAHRRVGDDQCRITHWVKKDEYFPNCYGVNTALMWCQKVKQRLEDVRGIKSEVVFKTYRGHEYVAVRTKEIIPRIDAKGVVS